MFQLFGPAVEPVTRRCERVPVYGAMPQSGLPMCFFLYQDGLLGLMIPHEDPVKASLKPNVAHPGKGARAQLQQLLLPGSYGSAPV